VLNLAINLIFNRQSKCSHSREQSSGRSFSPFLPICLPRSSPKRAISTLNIPRFSIIHQPIVPFFVCLLSLIVPGKAACLVACNPFPPAVYAESTSRSKLRPTRLRSKARLKERPFLSRSFRALRLCTRN
jgi:hypothetical protein